MNSVLRMYMLNQNGENDRKPLRRPEGMMTPYEKGDEHIRRHEHQYGGHEYEEPEDRYRGKDGRWKAGKRRSEYEGEPYDPDWENDGMNGDDDQQEENVIPFIPESRRIGFGSREREYQTRSQHETGNNQRQAAKVGGMMWMEPANGMEEFDEETAKRWVRSMRGEDTERPTGGRWSMDDLKPMAQKFGIKLDAPEFYEWYAMTNAMYSDYCEVAKKFNITSPEFYGMMALAWMRDKDAVPNKTAMYYEHCVKK